MLKIVTPDIVVGYLQCQRKAFLLLEGEERGIPHEIDDVVKSNLDTNKCEYRQLLKQEGHKLQAFSQKNFRLGLDHLADAKLLTNGLKAYCDVLTKHTSPENHKASYEPTLVVSGYTVQPEDKIRLLFAAHVLSKMQGIAPKYGFLVTSGSIVQKVKLESGRKSILKTLAALREWIESKPMEAPRVFLNKHCNSCKFRRQCKDTAEKLDDLSLLDRMTPKAINKYHKKGIFTVQQLSYLFRSRRPRKKRAAAPIRFSPELQALAIRSGKTLVQESPKLSRKNPELFLDIEGIPDQKYFYLFGLLVIDGNNKRQYSYWADDQAHEKPAWLKLIEKINEFPNAPIYHYGHYEVRAVEQLQKRHDEGLSSVKERLVNVNTFVFGKVYFPVRSNRLKELGKLFGMKWTDPEASGLQSLVWRYRWEQNRHSSYKERLITYNQEDCAALVALVENLVRIDQTGADQTSLDFTDRPNKDLTEVGTQIYNYFETVLQSAYADYDKNKITIRRDRLAGPVEKKKRGAPLGHQGYSRSVPTKFGKIVQLPHVRRCPQHKRELCRVLDGEIAEKIITDIVFTKSGCRKVVTKYFGCKSVCRKTNKVYLPVGFDELGKSNFGHSFQAWIIYQRIVLRLPYSVIIQTTADIFHEKTSEATLINFLRYLCSYYEGTESSHIRLLLESPFIHVDEIQFNIEGANQYVWVFTDGKRTFFKLTETREPTIVYELLSNYKGVLVSDFYPGYDSVNCRQQKCWVHLIRDINEDLWKSPFNPEFEAFVIDVRNLIAPIFEAIHKYGLKKRNLRKFRDSVERFYEKSIYGKDYKFEATVKYQKRLQRYRESLFTFLDEDAIPWNNNAAERAGRQLAVQRKISGTFYRNVAPQYLLLLGIAQTCRFQGKSFLKFLLSKEKDVDLFKADRPLKTSVAAASSSAVSRNVPESGGVL